MYFEYHKKSEIHEQDIFLQYPWLKDYSLSYESRVARFFLLEYLKNNWIYDWILEKDNNGKPKPIHGNNWNIYYWSISHSKNYVGFSVSNSTTWIDIAEYEERDISLFHQHYNSEYELLWEKSWKTFYMLWTAKESIIKAYWTSLDDIKMIHLKQKIGNDEYLFEFTNKKYKLKTVIDNTCIVSVLLDSIL